MPTLSLTKGYSVIVDDEDADLISLRYWASISSPTKVYAKRYVRGSKPYRAVYLHREIAERISGPIPTGFDVDHIDGDTLNCRRANLRTVSHQRNVWNQTGAGRDSQSGVRGVRHRPDKASPWQAYICEGRKMRALGSYPTMEEAREARLAAEQERELRHVA